jgi:hypothetical protein
MASGIIKGTMPKGSTLQEIEDFTEELSQLQASQKNVEVFTE